MTDDDLPSPSTDDKPDPSVVSLIDHAERVTASALPVLAKENDEASRQHFQVQLAHVLADMRTSPFGPANIAAGGLGVGLRDIDRAELPTLYRNAVAALRQCARVDECADWANKAQALAGYARMAKEDELFRLATRVRARAIRRCGELLVEIKDINRGRPKILDGGVPNLTRTRAAQEAGLSERQRKTALRVAEIPTDEFESAVEAERPATITVLAELGKRPAAVRPKRTTSPLIHETVLVEVQHVYARGLSLEQISTERQVSLLMRAWQEAGDDARRRFLQNIGCLPEN